MKMITINKNIQSEILMTTMEELVPKDSLFRKIDKYIDFTFIYDEVRDLYCENNGRPSIDPVVLFKLVKNKTRTKKNLNKKIKQFYNSGCELKKNKLIYLKCFD